MTKPWRNAAKGATIMELMISFSIMIILLTLSTQLFISSWRRFNQSNAVQAINTNAAMALDRLARDFRETCREDIAFEDDRYIIFRSPRNIKGTYMPLIDGSISWSSWIIYYRVNQSTPTGSSPVLARRVIGTDAALTGSIASYTGSADSGVIGGVDTKVTIAGRNIKSFRVVNTTNPDGTPVYTVTIVTETEYQSSRYTTSLTRSLCPILFAQD
jgi:hypothetical protein